MQLTLSQSFLNEFLPIKDKLYRIAKRLLISKEGAEDETQEIISKLWQMGEENRSKFKNLEANSITMIKNYCFDILKSKQVKNTTNEYPQIPDKASLSRTLEYVDAHQWVSKIINKLPKKERIIVQLRDVEQCSFKEISKIMEVPETTVRVFLSRARYKIRKEFQKIDEYGL